MVLSSTSCPTRAGTRPLNFRCRCNFSGPGTCEERRQEVLFYFQRQIDITTASLARRFKRSDSKPIGEGDNLMNCRFGHCALFGNLFRFPRINQGVLDNEPALSAPRTRIVLPSAFDFLKGYMSCCTCDSCHTFPHLS